MRDELQDRDESQNTSKSAESIEELSADTAYDLLSHHHRRAVIDQLFTADRALTILDLRNEIVEDEQGVDITEASNEQVERVLVSLYHVHVPKLAENGVVDYDQNRGLVEPTEKLDQLEPYLSHS